MRWFAVLAVAAAAAPAAAASPGNDMFVNPFALVALIKGEVNVEG